MQPCVCCFVTHSCVSEIEFIRLGVTNAQAPWLAQLGLTKKRVPCMHEAQAVGVRVRDNR